MQYIRQGGGLGTILPHKYKGVLKLIKVLLNFLNFNQFQPFSLNVPVFRDPLAYCLQLYDNINVSIPNIDGQIWRRID